MSAAEDASAELAAGLLRDIEAHARETYPRECCGAVVAAPGADPAVLRFRNIQDEMHASDPRNFPRDARIAYYPHPADLMAALALADEPRGRIVAFYHSHPDHGAYFSQEDVAQATPFGEPSYPGALQIVVSVYGAEVRDVKAFRWSDAVSAYVEAALVRA
jgi:proteasome lid subunit RPN8/RPN11